MEGMHLLAGIRWCPGINGSHVLIRPLSALGKTLWWRGTLCREGLQSKLSPFQPAATCQQTPAMASGSVRVEARNVPNGGSGVTGGRGSQEQGART